MTNKQQAEPPLTQDEIIRLERALFDVLCTLDPREKKRLCNSLCNLWGTNPRNRAIVENHIRKIFTSEDMKRMKGLVCFVYNFFDTDRKKAYAKWERLQPDNTDFIIEDLLRPSPEQQYRNAENALRFCSAKFEKALENSPYYLFHNGRFVIRRHAGTQEAIDRAGASRYPKANSYIKNATTLLYDHENPNYQGSMAASIQALELVVREITGENNFEKGINNLEKKDIKLHSQFRQAIINLYNFTSDDGVRHAHPNPVQNDKETASLILTVCSAIITFIESRIPKQDSK